MSNATNDRIAENLFDRLEALEPVLNLYQYAEMQKDLLGLLVRLDYEVASETVIKWEQEYAGLLADARADDRLELKGEYTDAY